MLSVMGLHIQPNSMACLKDHTRGPDFHLNWNNLPGSQFLLLIM